MKSVIVIGAGIGGLAASARLARQGYRVTLLEKNAQSGGRTDRLEKNGFRFDTGPTLFLMPEVFAETYADLGERMEDHLDLVQLDPTYRVHFQDGSSIDLTSNMLSMREQLEALEPGSYAAFLRFMSEGAQNYQLSLKYFVGRNFKNPLEYFSPANLPLLFRLKALVKHAKHTSRFFHDPRLLAAFSFQNMYLGLSPYDAPATYSLLQYTELADGVWFPRGGMYRVIESLASIAQANGVNIRYRAPVTKIEVDGSQAKGVVLEDGERIPADIILANADLPYVYSRLLPDDGTAARLSKKKYTSSALMFCWGVKGAPSPELIHHNVYLADHQYKKSFDQIFRDLTIPDEPSFYVNAPARTDPSFAPEGSDTLMVLVPAGHLNEEKPQDWDELEARARGMVISRLESSGIHDLERRITFETSWGPEFYQNALNLEKGAAFGLSHNFTQVGYLRPRNRHAHYGNLYFVGASTHPGTGLPIVLLSAKLVVERILQEQIVPGMRNYPIQKYATERI
ncbi:MAG: phytoene desaturase family protein [Omnitrophica WOR_2 bacterium]